MVFQHEVLSLQVVLDQMEVLILRWWCIAKQMHGPDCKLPAFCHTIIHCKLPGIAHQHALQKQPCSGGTSFPHLDANCSTFSTKSEEFSVLGFGFLFWLAAAVGSLVPNLPWLQPELVRLEALSATFSSSLSGCRNRFPFMCIKK